MTEPQMAIRPHEWRDGAAEPGPDVRAVRGRTHRIYFRESAGLGGRWVHKQTGDWFRWYPLLRFEGHVQQLQLGGGPR